MNQEENILALFDQYFKNAEEKQLLEDINYVDSLGKVGVSFEEYLGNLNALAAIPLVETGICDDIAFGDLYKSLISVIAMGDFSKPQTIASIHIESSHSSYQASESAYLMAA
jgi:hypothetical protein